MWHKDDNGPWTRHQRGLRGLPAAAAAPRPDLLLGHAPPARRSPAGHARAVRLRAHGRRDRRRPATGPPTAEARRAALDAWEHELHAACAGRSRTRSSARSSTPAGATGCRSTSWHVHALDARRLRPGADRERRGARGLHGRLGRAPSGRIMAPLLGVPERFHADFGRLGQAFQLTNFIRDVARTGRSTASTCRPDRAPRPTWRARDAAAARAARQQVARARRCSRPPSPPSPPPPHPCARHPLASRSTCGCSTASRRSGSTCSGAGSACAWRPARRSLAAVRR